MYTSTFGLWLLTAAASVEGDALPGTDHLTMEGDLAAQMVTSMDEYVAQAIKDSIESRQRLWDRDYGSHEAYAVSVAPNRERFRTYIGCVDERAPSMPSTILRQQRRQAKSQRPEIILYTPYGGPYSTVWTEKDFYLNRRAILSPK